jgi:hypothetical protein
MKDQFNGNTEKRCYPPQLIGHKVYKMVKNVHVVLGKRKRIGNNIEEDDIWKKQLIFWGARYGPLESSLLTYFTYIYL